jgi:hypothetical protein
MRFSARFPQYSRAGAAIVLTCPWHVRDARSVAERLAAPIYVPPPDGRSADRPIGARARAFLRRA